MATGGGPIVGEASNVAEAGPSGPNPQSGDTPQTIVAPPRFVPSGPLHTIIIVDLPLMEHIIKGLQDNMGLTADGADGGHLRMSERGRDGQVDNHHHHSEGGANVGPSPLSAGLDAPENGGPLSGQALPLLFVRGSDGMGYHSGRSIACDHIYPEPVGLDGIRGSADGRKSAADGSWLGGNTGGWTLRVI